MLKSELQEAITQIEKGKFYRLSEHRWRQIHHVLRWVFANWEEVWGRINTYDYVTKGTEDGTKRQDV